MDNEAEIPTGYSSELFPGPLVNFLGRVYYKRTVEDDQSKAIWAALRVEPYHVNVCGNCHGSVMACLAEMAVSGPADEPGEPAAAVIEVGMHVVRAPKLGDLIEVCSTVTRRSQGLVFVHAQAIVMGELAFTAHGIYKTDED